MPDDHDNDDDEVSALDKPPVCSMSPEEIRRSQELFREYMALREEYTFIWKHRRVLVLALTPSTMSVSGLRWGGNMPLNVQIEMSMKVQEVFPDLPIVNSLEELMDLAQRMDWKYADKIHTLDLDKYS
ncbi:MAG: hypothetical protein ACRCZF_09845 [Gemmataceae bacterium]